MRRIKLKNAVDGQSYVCSYWFASSEQVRHMHEQAREHGMDMNVSPISNWEYLTGWC